MLPDVADGGQAVGDRERDDFAYRFGKFWAVCVKRREFLRGVVAGSGDAVLQYKSGNAFCSQVFRDVVAFTVDREGHESATRRDDDGGAVVLVGRRPENGEAWLGDVGDDFRVPQFRE